VEIVGKKFLFCEKCDPLDLIETIEGYVCGICGMVSRDRIVIKNYRPYDDKKCHNEPLNRNQRGTLQEQINSPDSESILRQSKLNAILDHNQTILQEAKSEITRIFAYLDLPKKHESTVFKKYVKIRSALSEVSAHKKHTHPNYLVPFITQYICRKNNIFVNERDLLEIARIPRIKDPDSPEKTILIIPRKKINTLKLIVLQFFPHYEGKVKMLNVLQKIEGLREEVGLDKSFYFLSKHILFKLWNRINNKKDRVIAAEIACTTALCYFENDERINVHKICNELGVAPSTPQERIEKDVFDYYKYYGFTSLKKSADLLKKILILENIVEDTEDLKPYYCEVLKLMRNVSEFYFFKNTHYYLFIFKKSKTEVVITYFTSHKLLNNAQKSYNNENIMLIFMLDLSKYSGKDPPIISFFD